MLIVYGALCLPVASLTTLSYHNYTTLAVLYTIFNTVGFIAGAWMNIFVPYVMQQAVPSFTKVNLGGSIDEYRKNREEKGLQTSVWGGVSMNVGIVGVFIVTIGVSYANSATAANAGLYMTSAAGGICIIAALAGWRFLPLPPATSSLDGKNFWSLPVHTCAYLLIICHPKSRAKSAVIELFRGVYMYPEAFKFLIAFVVYNDSIFAFSTVTGRSIHLRCYPRFLD